MEDALKRLDKLTQEEARTAIAENLRATHVVDGRVKGVTERVLAVDDRLAGVDKRVAGVDDRVDQHQLSYVCRLSTLSALRIVPYPPLQKSNYGRTSTDGFPHQIHPPTTI